ncbi:tax1-binding protein 3 [Pyxicephalus adspersus]
MTRDPNNTYHPGLAPLLTSVEDSSLLTPRHPQSVSKAETTVPILHRDRYHLDYRKEGIYVTRVSEGGPAEIAGLQAGDKIMQVNGWDMTMVTHDQARKRLTKRNEEVVRLLVTRKSLQEAVRQSMRQ